MLLSQRRVIMQLPRRQSCRRLVRNTGWWKNVWNKYFKARFKTFRISRATFQYILDRIEPILARQTLTEDPISPDERLAICLYRLGRGEYYYTIAEMVGRGVSTVSSIAQSTDSYGEVVAFREIPMMHYFEVHELMGHTSKWIVAKYC